MLPRHRTALCLLGLVLFLGSCDGNSPTSSADRAAGIGIRAALIPTPADGDALPINRIRVSAARVTDGVVVATTTTNVTPTDSSWTVDLTVPEPFASSTVYVFVRLFNVAGNGTEALQFSGRVGPTQLAPGQTITPDVPIVRGPVANLFATDVSITSAPATMVQGATATLVASAGTSGTVTPTVYWTSLAPTVVTMSGGVATAVGSGAADVVASAGMFADTVNIQVVPAPVGGVVSWAGPVSGNWSVASNWSPARVPTFIDSVFIDVAGTYTVTLDQDVQIVDLTLGDGATSPALHVANYLELDGNLTVAAGAVVQGTDTLDLTGASVLAFDGDISPGASPGRLTILGNYALGPQSTVRMELGGTTVGTGHDQLVTGGIDLDGTLEVDTVGGFVPAPGDRFPLMLYGTRLGNFATVTLPVLSGVVLDTVWANAQNFDTLYVVASGGVPGSLVNWTGGGDGTTWSQGSNWSTGVAPGPGDSVVIRAAGPTSVTLDVDADVYSLTIGQSGGSLQTLDVVGANLRASANILVDTASTVNVGLADTLSSGGLITVSGASTLNLEGATVDGAFENQGLMGVRNTSTLTGPFTTTSTSDIFIEGNAAEGLLIVAGDFTNEGLIELTDSGSGYGTLSVAGTVVNNGTIRSLPGVGGWTRFIFGLLDNRGTVEVTHNLSVSELTGTHRNSGTISVTGGSFTVNLNQASFINEAAGSITLAGTGGAQIFFPSGGAPPSFTHAGSIVIGAGRTFLVSGSAGSLDFTGGSLANAGTFDVGALAAVNAPAFEQTGTGRLRLNTTTWNGSGTLTNPAGAILDLRGAVVNGDVENRGEIEEYGATINGRLIVPSSDLATFTTPSTPYVFQVAGVDVDGAVFDRVPLVINGSDIVRLDNVSFENQTGGTQLWVTHPGAGSPFTFDGLTFTQPPSLAYVRADDSAPADGTVLTIDLVNSDPDDGSAFTTENNSMVTWLDAAGALNAWTGLGDGTNWSDAANWSDGVPVAADTVVIGTAGAAVNLDVSATVSELTLSAAIGALALEVSDFDLTVTGTIDVGATATLTVANTIIADSLRNQGTIELTSTPSGSDAVLSVTGGTLVNEASGVVRSTLGSGAGTTRGLLGAFDNRGVLDVAYRLGLAVPSLTNAGTVSITNDTLSISVDAGVLSNAASGSIATSSTGDLILSVTNAGSLVNLGSITNGTGRSLSVSGSGSFDLSSGTFSNSGTFSVLGLAEVTGPANYTNTADLVFTGGIWYGTTLTNAAGGTLTATSFSRIEADLVNQGTASITSFTLRVLGSVDATSPITGPGSMTIEGPGRTLQGTVPAVSAADSITLVGPTTVGGNLQVGLLDVNGQAMTVQGNLSLVPTGPLIMTSAADSVTVTGNLSVTSGVPATLSGGTLIVGGDVTVNSGSFLPNAGHITVLNGGTSQTVSTTAGRLGSLDVAANNGGVVLATDVEVNGTLTGTGTTVSGGNRLNVTGLNIDGTTFDGVPLTLTTAVANPPLVLDNATFGGYPTNEAQIRIFHPGGVSANYDLTGLVFNTVLKVPDTGFYLQLIDTSNNDLTFDVNVSSNLLSTEGAPFTQVSGPDANDTPTYTW